MGDQGYVLIACRGGGDFLLGIYKESEGSERYEI